MTEKSAQQSKYW